MLSKVDNSSIKFGTDKIKEFCLSNNNVKRIQDNLIDSLLVETDCNVFIYNYKTNKKYNHDRIQLEFNYIKIIKQINSFDQNNVLIANKIRKYVLSQCYDCDTILGIGGEYYLYFLFVKAKKYYGISNHQSIIDDANYNIPFSSNYIVNYNEINSYPIIKICDIILLNVSNINNNIVTYISQIVFTKLIVITCNITDKKMLLLKNNFKVTNINTFSNYDGYIKIISLKK